MPELFIRLAAAIREYDSTEDEAVWYIGECDYCCLSDLIPAAYWHFAEWHGGQWSPEYAALCALGRIFSPGMTSGPEPDTSEAEAYKLLEIMATEARQ